MGSFFSFILSSIIGSAGRGAATEANKAIGGVAGKVVYVLLFLFTLVILVLLFA